MIREKLPELQIKKSIRNEDDNIIRVCGVCIILLIFMSNMVFLSNEGCLATIFLHSGANFTFLTSQWLGKGGADLQSVLSVI